MESDTCRSCHSADSLERRFRFETLISETSAALFAALPEQLDTAIERVLDKVREFFEVDRCALLSVSADQKVVNVRVASYAEGLPHVPVDLDLAQVFPWSYKTLVVERAPVLVSSIAEIPAEAAIEREAWMQLPIRSALTLPIEIGAGIGYMIVLNTVHQEREWPDFFVSRLRVLGELLAISLERKELLAELRANEARLASGADLAGLGFYEVNFEEGVMYTDNRLRDLCGVPPEREEGLQVLEFWLEHLHPDDLKRVSHMRQQLHDGALDRLSLEYRSLHPARGETWIQHLAGVNSRDASGRAVATYGVLRDITKRKQVDEDFRDLSRRLIRAHEEERALLARELHDDVTQRLAVLAIDVGSAELAAPDGPQAGSMRSVREGLVRLSEDVHTLAYQLHPSVLEELGLAEALRAECERRRRRGRIELSVDLDPLPAGVGKDAALCLFRIAQEALNNVVAHARAQTASVKLRGMDDGLILAIRDDGVGFDPTDPGYRRSLGLVSMRERVRLVNGTLDIESAPGRGTGIVAWVPMQGGSQ